MESGGGSTAFPGIPWEIIHSCLSVPAIEKKLTVLLCPGCLRRIIFSEAYSVSHKHLIMTIDPPALEINNLKRREIQATFFAHLIRGYINALGHEEAMRVASIAIREDAWQTGKKMAEKYHGNTFSKLLRVVREVWAEDNSLEFEILEKTSQSLSFNVTRCRYAELYDRLGLKEYGLCLSCDRDEALLRGFNPHMRLLRSQTIMQGAGICDFRIILEKAENHEKNKY